MDESPKWFFLQKLGMGEGVPGLHTHAKFHRCDLQPLKSPQLVIFGINFS